MSRTYDWYRHHAWGGLAILSLFSALHAFLSIPVWITLPVGGMIAVYIAINLFRTYRAAGELKKSESTPSGLEVEKAHAKTEKKRLKAEAKQAKKSGKEN